MHERRIVNTITVPLVYLEPNTVMWTILDGLSSPRTNTHSMLIRPLYDSLEKSNFLSTRLNESVVRANDSWQFVSHHRITTVLSNYPTISCTAATAKNNASALRFICSQFITSIRRACAIECTPASALFFREFITTSLHIDRFAQHSENSHTHTQRTLLYCVRQLILLADRSVVGCE